MVDGIVEMNDKLIGFPTIRTRRTRVEIHSHLNADAMNINAK